MNLANNNVLACIRFPPDKGKRAMLSTEQINDLHRLYWSEHWPIRKIERHLRMGWHTIRKYLDAPAQGPAKRSRRSKLDAFKSTIAEWLQKDAKVSGTVIEQRLRPLGYTGGPTILRDYLKRARSQIKPNRAFIRMEPAPGERFEVDWGHFGALDYCGDKRKLYAFALVEAHSRTLYLEFTHSQSFETFVRCHIHAFLAPPTPGIFPRYWQQRLSSAFWSSQSTGWSGDACTIWPPLDSGSNLPNGLDRIDYILCDSRASARPVLNFSRAARRTRIGANSSGPSFSAQPSTIRLPVSRSDRRYAGSSVLEAMSPSARSILRLTAISPVE